ILLIASAFLATFDRAPGQCLFGIRGVRHAAQANGDVEADVESHVLFGALKRPEPIQPLAELSTSYLFDFIAVEWYVHSHLGHHLPPLIFNCMMSSIGTGIPEGKKQKLC